MRTVVLIPRRAGDPIRDRVWRWVAHRYGSEHPEWPIFEGHDDGAHPFRRSVAINRAAQIAGSWDVAVVGDADSFVDPIAARMTVAHAHAHDRMVIGHTRFAYLSKAMSNKVMDGFEGNWDAGIEWQISTGVSSFIAVPRSLWDLVGGFDEEFTGWGMEDVAFFIACETIGGPVERIEGTVWHLWHPVQKERPVENRERLQRYEESMGDPFAIMQLMKGRAIA